MMRKARYYEFEVYCLGVFNMVRNYLHKTVQLHGTDGDEYWEQHLSMEG